MRCALTAARAKRVDELGDGSVAGAAGGRPKTRAGRVLQEEQNGVFRSPPPGLLLIPRLAARWPIAENEEITEWLLSEEIRP